MRRTIPSVTDRRPPIPYRSLETLFLDVGNTLVSMDFGWVRAELAAVGIACTAGELRRAEAAGRPHFSAALTDGGAGGHEDFFSAYLRIMLTHLDGPMLRSPRDPSEIANLLAPVLGGPGCMQRLWSWVLPGVREALGALREMGLKLLAVSNADGTVEESLIRLGLRPYFDAVLDSHHVGFEKPDPRIFDRAIEISGATRDRTLHVGDIYAVDVLGARAAGLHALLVDPFDDWSGVDCVRIPDLTALAAGFTAGACGNE